MKITVESLEKAIRQEMETAVGKRAETLSTARAALEAAYLGSPLEMDDARKEGGYATFIDRTVMETVEWAKPGLLRVFASSDEIVRVEPRRPEHEQAAADATDYLNQIVFGQAMFTPIFNVISDALLQRAGWWKVWHDDDPARVPVVYTGLSEEEAYALMLRHGDMASVELSRGKEPSYSVTVATDDPASAPGGVRIICLPPERVVYNQDALDIASARFVAHWEEKTLAELRRMGFDSDILDGMAEDNETWPETQIRNRINDDDADADSGRTGDMKTVRLYEAYIVMEQHEPATGHKANGSLLDGAGAQSCEQLSAPAMHERSLCNKPKRVPYQSLSERRFKVDFAGSDANSVKVLRAEPWAMPRPPLFPLSSVPVPHKPIGLGLADLVMDIQRLRTELSRQMLDGLANANQGELHVNKRNTAARIDYDQLLNRRIGGIYESEGEVTIQPFPADSAIVAQAAAALQMTDKAKETRTGVGQQMEGISADALQGTATGASIYQEAANERLELVARVIAETLFKPVASYALLLVSRYQNKPLQYRLKGRFFQWNPATWDPAMDVRVAVGLGTGNRARHASDLRQVISLQAQIMERLGKNSPVRLAHFITACHKMAQSLGFESPEQFFGTVEDAKKAEEAMMNAPPSPSPEMKKMEMEQQKAAASIQLEQQKAQAKFALEQEKNRVNAALKAKELNAEQELDAMKIALGQRGQGIGNLRQVNL